MKKTIKRKYFPVLIGILVVLVAFGCGKYQELADADYPDQVIYMPAAGQLYHLTEPKDTYDVPTPGNPYRFRIDEGTNKVIIPLGVVRGGIANSGSVSITVTDRPDTVSTLIDKGQLQAQLVPASAYALPTTVVLADGSDAVSFELTLDLPFLLSHPGQVFAVGLSISSAERKTNPDKETTIVVIDTNLLAD
ncbi:BT_3987 domain-containing protein [Parapedobacter sp. GCM10030251]|uniref:BT_3987 domain-containing protein n=1 Tax=Parapedobacter sp. GCM10030251 TaxID=3273419 RepID=UPI00360E2F5A